MTLKEIPYANVQAALGRAKDQGLIYWGAPNADDNGNLVHWGRVTANEGESYYEVHATEHMDDGRIVCECTCTGASWGKMCKHEALVLAGSGVLKPEYTYMVDDPTLEGGGDG